MNKKYMKNTAILFASMTITKIVGAVFKIPLANILGGTGMGYFSTAYGLYSPVFALTAAGIPAVMMRLTAQNIAAGRPENALRTRRTALALFSVLGLAGTLVVALFSAFFAEHIACSPESTPAVIAISPAVMICCIASVLRGYHEGLSDVVPSAAAAVAEAVSRAAAGLALSYGVVFYAKYRFDNGLDVFGIQYADYSSAYAAALPYAAAGAIAAVSLSELCGLISLLISDRKRRTYPAPDSTPADRKRVIGFRLIREIIPVAASALVMNCVSFIDLLTVTRTLKASAEMNAVYFQREFSDILPAAGGLPGLANFMYGSYTGIAMTMFMLIPSFAGMTEKTSVPEIAAAWERKDENAAAQGCCTLFRAAAAIGFPACVGAAVLAEPLLSMLYRSRTAEVSACAGAFAVLCAGGLFMIIASAMFGVFQAIGKAHIPLILMCCAVTLKALLNPLLISIPALNISGAAVSTAVGYIVMAAAGSLILRRKLGGKISVFACVRRPLFCSLLCGVSAALVFQVVKNTLPSPLNVITAVFAGAIVYGISLISTLDFRKKRRLIKSAGKNL